MELWQQILAVVLGLMVLFFAVPSIKGALEKSKNAEEKHWGSVALLAAVLIGFILLMIYSVRH
jgi:cellobiose-specific phosphotransferase system component IIC